MSFYKFLDQERTPVCTWSQERLGKRVASLSGARMQEVCAALRFAFGCDAQSPCLRLAGAGTGPRDLWQRKGFSRS